MIFNKSLQYNILLPIYSKNQKEKWISRLENHYVSNDDQQSSSLLCSMYNFIYKLNKFLSHNFNKQYRGNVERCI